jgi:hypothetical protein
MAQAYEGRRQRRGENGSMRSHGKHVREDMATLQDGLSQLRSDLGDLAALQWHALSDRVNGGVHYVGEQVRIRPLTSLGLAAGAGLLAGIALINMNGRHRRH